MVETTSQAAETVPHAYDKIDKGWLRSKIHKSSKFLKQKFSDFKSGRLFQGIKKIAKSIGRLGAKLARAANLLGYAIAAWEVFTDTWDAHTVINIGVAVGFLCL